MDGVFSVANIILIDTATQMSPYNRINTYSRAMVVMVDLRFPTMQQSNLKPQRHHDVLAKKASSTVAFMKWQHPAARSLLHDPAPVVALFIPAEFAGGRFY
ncbi:hypothetical protein PIB30_095127 [Stylosanthes scabra]|uniref:Uncharacterized protein n=1 Tax=Stylosanthes scabra TaxID=79078 RepID=A0ABU6UUI4_9FABA|nr:hypothetical protein [Stylosanthes scabra]